MRNDLNNIPGITRTFMVMNKCYNFVNSPDIAVRALWLALSIYTPYYDETKSDIVDFVGDTGSIVFLVPIYEALV